MIHSIISGIIFLHHFHISFWHHKPEINFHIIITSLSTSACWWVKFRIYLKKPCFSHLPGKNRYNCWKGKTQKLAISSTVCPPAYFFFFSLSSERKSNPSAQVFREQNLLNLLMFPTLQVLNTLYQHTGQHIFFFFLLKSATSNVKRRPVLRSDTEK